MSFIVTASGRKFYPLAPDPESIIVEDVAHHLSKVARWTGATRGDDATYSVAQHAVYVSRFCALNDALWGLHHDDSEAYVADMARPVKHSPQFAAYRTVEDKLMSAVCTRFGLPFEMPASVHEADYRLLITEYRELMTHPPADDPDANWHDNFAGAYPFSILKIWTPRQAREKFIERHYALGGK